jgi:hypothetical protein
MEQGMNLKTTFSVYEKLLKTKFDSRSQSSMEEYDIRSSNSNIEYEVRFKDIKKLDFERVYKYLLTKGFVVKTEQYQLKIGHTLGEENSNESKIRCQVNDLSEIKDFCNKNVLPETTEYLFKEKFMKEYPRYYDNSDYGFRVSIQKEFTISVTDPKVVELNSKWKSLDKMFRYMNRVTLVHPQIQSIVVDFSTVKSIKKDGQLVKEKIFSSSRLFEEEEEYELEIELVNLEYIYSNLPEVFLNLNKTIKYISSGIQDSNFPIPFSEQLKISSEYKKIITQSKKDKEQSVSRLPEENINLQRLLPSSMFIGPSSYTLQKINLIDSPTNSEPCIMKDFSVTDKADGERKMCYISSNGKIYFISNNMEIQYTGAICQEPKLYNSLMDGEFIKENKLHERIDLYAAFDLYIYAGNEIRNIPFIQESKVEKQRNRYYYLNALINGMNVKYETEKDNVKIVTKKFYTPDDSKNIMKCCSELFKTIEKAGIYETDGLIFTSNSLGVGLEPDRNSMKDIKNSRLTWRYSFKWKPPEFNTIDFLVKIKQVNSRDEISYIISNTTQTCIPYKCLYLYVGYDEQKQGFINPQKLLMEDFVIPKLREGISGNTYKPVLFSPTNPTDSQAHLCYLPLIDDAKLLTKDNDLIETEMVVEFAYEFNEDKRFRWVPLRVRYDKTAEYRKFHNKFGNDFVVANSNWLTIHNPISKEMITDKNLKLTMEDVEIKDLYYNRGTGVIYTNNLRKFHNQKVKKLLFDSVINGVTDCKLIDYAVGKGGDLNKWIMNKPKFIFGIDISKDNIHNSKDGVCSRYLGLKRQNNDIFKGMFIRGDSSKLIKTGEFVKIDDDDEEEKVSMNVMEQVFGLKEKTNHFGNYVGSLHNIAIKGFDVGSIQFALHYMFKDEDSVNNFMKNLCDTIKVGGTFVGTCYDGHKIFNMLSKTDPDQSIEIYNKEKTTKIWSIKKKYFQEEFLDDESSLGMTISVYQDSINQEIEEYLVNFTYFSRCMMLYGFEEEKLLPGTSDLPGTGNFELIYKRYGGDSKFGKDALTDKEKQISFLNKYFVYRKVRSVNSDMVYNKLLHKVDEQETYLNKISTPIKLNKQIILTM